MDALFNHIKTATFEDAHEELYELQGRIRGPEFHPLYGCLSAIEKIGGRKALSRLMILAGTRKEEDENKMIKETIQRIQGANK